MVACLPRCVSICVSNDTVTVSVAAVSAVAYRVLARLIFVNLGWIDVDFRACK